MVMHLCLFVQDRCEVRPCVGQRAGEAIFPAKAERTMRESSFRRLRTECCKCGVSSPIAMYRKGVPIANDD